MTKVANKVRSARGLTQQQAAEAIGCSIPTYHKKESGKIPFTVSEALKLAELFEVEVEGLISSKDVEVSFKFIK